MDITIAQKQGRVPVTVFHLKGDLNVGSYEQLQDRARQAVEAGTRHLVLDLAEVPFLSSAGIRAINHIFNLLRSTEPGPSDDEMRKALSAGTYRSPHLKLLSPRTRVLEALSMAGVDMFLEVHNDLTEAINSF